MNCIPGPMFKAYGDSTSNKASLFKTSSLKFFASRIEALVQTQPSIVIHHLEVTHDLSADKYFDGLLLSLVYHRAHFRLRKQAKTKFSPPLEVGATITKARRLPIWRTPDDLRQGSFSWNIICTPSVMRSHFSNIFHHESTKRREQDKPKRKARGSHRRSFS